MIHHILFSSALEPIILQPKKHYTLGRSTENPIVLESHLISRLHAKIFWKEQRFWLCDQGSRNGTLLNGEEMEPGEFYVLEDKHEIRIDPFTLLFRQVEGELELLLKLENDRLKWARLKEKLIKLPEGEQFEGNLALYRLSPLLQLLMLLQKTGVLYLKEGQKREGTLSWKAGQIVAIYCGAQQGIEAAYSLFAMKEGYFQFRAEPVSQDSLFFISTPQLLLKFFPIFHPYLTSS
jgi:pSer/pThr/pTyr-binding forkhead associated (FHA) protein